MVVNENNEGGANRRIKTAFSNFSFPLKIHHIILELLKFYCRKIYA